VPGNNSPTEAAKKSFLGDRTHFAPGNLPLFHRFGLNDSHQKPGIAAVFVATGFSVSDIDCY